MAIERAGAGGPLLSNPAHRHRRRPARPRIVRKEDAAGCPVARLIARDPCRVCENRRQVTGTGNPVGIRQRRAADPRGRGYGPCRPHVRIGERSVTLTAL
jgi:hypothetical protein